ncbi:MAG: glycosyltransferase [Actinobacteria bacterium]|nr:glycosyltransferase [Actinomycetota bacterium]
MRIALLHLFAWPQVRRGGERYLHELSRYLVQRGHEVEVVVASADEIHHEDGSRSTALRPHDPHVSPDDLTLTVRTALTLLRTRPDVVHAFVPNLALAGVAVRRPTVFTLLGYVAPQELRTSAWERAAHACDVVTALNPEIAADLRAAAGRPAEMLTPGVDLARFPLEPGVRAGPPRLLVSGNLGPDTAYKGLDRMVAAFAVVLDRHPGSRLLLSGPGDPEWALRGTAADVRARVDVLGAGDLASLVHRYQQATVTVSAAHDEAFGLGLLESLACGTPIVAAPRGGPLGIVTPETGRLADPSDELAFAEAIDGAIELARRPETPGRCRDRAARWSWDVVGQDHEALYARLVGAPAPVRSRPRVAPARTSAAATAGGHVSVVIPVRDRAGLLRDCLEGLAAQTMQDFDVVVVDDGSTDDSGDVARGFHDRLDVRVVTTSGVGAVEARRRGVANSDADYLAFTDSDCIPDPGWLAAGVRELERGADVVQGRTRAAGPVTPLDRTVAAAPGDGLYATCNVFYRRAAFERAGGFDPDLGARVGFRPGRSQRALGMGEDTVLGWRVRRQGAATHTEDAVVRHQVFPPDLRDDLRRWWMAGGFPGLVDEVPELRTEFLRARVLVPGPVRPLLLAGVGLLVLRRRGAGVGALLAWVLAHGRRNGWRPRWWAHALLRDAVLESALIAGSARRRTIVL